MKPILRLYPAAWRRRYGDELSDLLEEMPASPATILDLLRGALTLHLRALFDRLAPRLLTAGGAPMPTHTLQRHPTASALAAALLAAPTAIFVTVSILAYQVRLPGMEAWLAPFMDGLQQAPWIVELFLGAAPLVAFVLAALPLVGLRTERVDGELRITLALRARRLNLFVVALCVVVGAALANYLLGELLFALP